MGMLFFAFLDMDINPRSFQKGVLWVLLANLLIAFLGYWIFSFFDTNLALAAFLTAIAPTAISSPVIISFIEGRVEYVVASVLLTNIVMALVVPFALPFLISAASKISVWEVLQPVLVVMFVPLILARLVLLVPPGALNIIRKGKIYSFPIWLLNLFIISAKAADFLRNGSGSSTIILVKIALVSLAICIVNFSLGALIGGRKYWQESSQALGQKNNSFVIWIALTFINPLVAMGPTFYVLYHNLYNSFQIYLFEKRKHSSLQEPK
jgi:BASS family bile acid:Na+ symporter